MAVLDLLHVGHELGAGASVSRNVLMLGVVFRVSFCLDSQFVQLQPAVAI